MSEVRHLFRQLEKDSIKSMEIMDLNNLNYVLKRKSPYLYGPLTK